jgi:COP9 signalosome complex subunit 1
MADKGADKKKESKDKTSKSKGSSKGKSGQDKKAEEKKIVVVPSKDFDLPRYASRYEGQTKIARLRFIAERCPTLQNEAYKLALEELKKGRNTTPFRQIVEKLGGGFDSSWADAVDKQRTGQLDEYEAALANAKQNQQRSKIRTGHNKIGDYYFEGGDYSSALRSYMRAQEHSLTPETNLELCFNVVRTAVAMRNFVHVASFAEQAESNPIHKASVNSVAEMKVACGLAALNSRKYREAAQRFSEAAFDGVAALPKMIAVEDVAVYVGLCGLAEFSRSELKNLIDDSNFRAFAETVPVISKMLTCFYRSNYADCLAALESLKNDLQLDYYLHEHCTGLFEKIRNKALKEYFLPYEAVDLQKMANAFATSIPALEKELSKLIVANEISARIDSFNKRLVARQVTSRTGAYDKTIETGESFQTNSRALLLRVNLTRNNFMVKPTARSGGGGGPMGMPPGMLGMGMGAMNMMMGLGGGHPGKR